MAAGDRKIKVQRMTMFRGAPVMCEARWTLEIENKLASDVQSIAHGSTLFELAATGAAFNALTGSAIRTAVINAVTADPNTPANDGVTA